MFKIAFLFVLLLVFGFLGCQEKSNQTVPKIEWDKDLCSRCVMVISDNKHAVLLKDPTTKVVHKFDDIGCMVLWFKEEHVEFKDSITIWVTDADSGEWIDARKAFYTSGNTTPMAFGFNAYKSEESIKDAKEILTYSDLLKRIK